MAVEDIKRLARMAARSGLNLRHARDMFNAMYVADALILEGNNTNRAAKRSGVHRATLHRHLGRVETTHEEVQ